MNRQQFEQLMEYLGKSPTLSLKEAKGDAPIDPEATHYNAVLVFNGMTYFTGDLFIKFDTEWEGPGDEPDEEDEEE